MFATNQNKLFEIIFIFIYEIIYIIPLKKKEPGLLHMLSPFVNMIFSILIICFLTLNPKIEPLRLCLCLPFITASIYYSTYCQKSGSFYAAIWILISTQFTLNLCYLINTFYLKNSGFTAVNNNVVIIFFMSLCFLLFSIFATIMPSKKTYHIGPKQFSSAVIFLIFFEIMHHMILTAQIEKEQPVNYVALLLAQFYCISFLYLQTVLFKKAALERELLTMDLLMKQQETQYRISKENIDLINQKCHDLKHQLNALKTIGDEESKARYLSELEQSLEIYGAIVKTGNYVLDTILTEKSLICQSKQIRINCMVDGKMLNFIDPIDLYAIMGNAIDNAMEAVEKLHNKELRLIDINIFSKNQFLSINISNPCEEPLSTFKNGIPISTKKDAPGYHGYGIRSIRHNVQRYNGDMTISTEHQIFSLKILIPLPK